jgi:tetratricopeptide (TPR) repeat protein
MHRAVPAFVAAALALIVPACHTVEPLPPGAEARALDGKVLYAPPLEAPELTKREQILADARLASERNPQDADALVMYGRSLAYLGRFAEAIEVFTRGIDEHPDDARFYRQRGHRYITTRRFDLAIADLEHAASLVQGKPDEIEPDVAPNPAHGPLETLQSNIYYHLGLAHYLLGEFESAQTNYELCRNVSLNADNQCSAAHWLYMTLRRQGKATEAREVVASITPDMPVLEYHAYHKLCLAYAGKLDIDELYEELNKSGVDSVDFATGGYGVGNWHLYNGDREGADKIFREVVSGAQWHAFGHIAAENELAR